MQKGKPDKEIHILMILKNYLKVPNGTQWQAISLAKALKEKGCIVEFVVANVEGIKNKKGYKDPSGILVHILPYIAVRVLGTFLYLISLAIFIIANRKKYHIYHIYFAKYSAFAASLLKPLHHKVIICRPAGAGIYGDISVLKKETWFPWLILRTLRKVDAIVTVSKAIKDEFISENFSEEKVVLIPNGVDVSRFNMKHQLANTSLAGDLSESSKIIRLLFVGRLSPHKGLKYLFDALKKMDDKIKYQLTLIGDGEIRSELEEYVRQSNLSSMVTFAGSQLNVEKYYKESDIFILPSISEGLSNSLLEAMASGLAVIAAKVSGTEDVIEDGINGILVESKNSAQIASAIVNLSESESLRIKLGENARETVLKNFSIDSVAEKYIALYKSLLNKVRD